MSVLEVTPVEAGWRADVFVAHHLSMSRTQVQKLFENGLVHMGGRPIKSSLRLEDGQQVATERPPVRKLDLEPVSMDLDILYEDRDIVVLDKPRGLVVHPGSGTLQPTLVHGLLARYEGSLSVIGGVERPGIVHRLDKDTSGLLVVARTDIAHRRLSEAFAEGRMQKMYLALVEGHLAHPLIDIDQAIGRHPHERHKMTILPGGRRSLTRIEHLETLTGYTYVRALPRTGRTHQIRVHLKSIGHPILGDEVYGKPSPLLKGQFLHACRLRFDHPISGEPMTLESPLPDALTAILNQLRTY